MNQVLFRVKRKLSLDDGPLTFGPLVLDALRVFGSGSRSAQLRAGEVTAAQRAALADEGWRHSPVEAVQAFVAGQFCRIDRSVAGLVELPGQPCPADEIHAAIGLLAQPHTVVLQAPANAAAPEPIPEAAP